MATLTPQPLVAAPIITLKDSFTGSGISGNGAEPYSRLTLFSGNGKYYGVTESGGANDAGAIYEFNPITGQIAIKASFTETGGGFGYPYSRLTPSGNDTFYGTTSRGGANDQGVIYEFNPISGLINLRASFDGSTNGEQPVAALTPGGNGKFYGTTAFGGVPGVNYVGGSRQLRRRVGAPLPLPWQGERPRLVAERLAGN